MLYELMKFLHIIFASIWFGGCSYNILLRKNLLSSGEDFSLVVKMLKIIKQNNRLLILPASLLQIITGLGLSHIAMFEINELWIVASLSLWAFLAVTTHISSRIQTKTINMSSNNIKSIKSNNKNLFVIEIINLIFLILIFLFMIYKPEFE